MRDRIADTLRVWEESGAYTPWEYLREPAKEPWRKKADILLDLMTGPTDTMVSAGIEAEERVPDDEGVNYRQLKQTASKTTYAAIRSVSALRQVPCQCPKAR